MNRYLVNDICQFSDDPISLRIYRSWGVYNQKLTLKKPSYSSFINHNKQIVGYMLNYLYLSKKIDVDLIIIIQKVFEKYPDDFDLWEHRSNWFGRAIAQNDHKLVKYWIDLGVDDWNLGLISACRAGLPEMVILMLDYGADDWKGANRIAHEGKNPEVILIITERMTQDWSGLLNWGCLRGYYPHVQRAIQEGANCWSRAINYATYGGNSEIIQLITNQFEENKNNFEKKALFFCQGLFGACQGGHPHIIADFTNIIQNNLRIKTTQKFPTMTGTIRESAFILAIRSGKVALIDYLVNVLELFDPITSPNRGLHIASRYEDLEMIKKMISLGATNLNDGLTIVCDYQNDFLYDYLRSQGADNCGIHGLRSYGNCVRH